MKCRVDPEQTFKILLHLSDLPARAQACVEHGGSFGVGLKSRFEVACPSEHDPVCVGYVEEVKDVLLIFVHGLVESHPRIISVFR